MNQADFTFHTKHLLVLPANMAEPNRLSKEFSGALRTFAYFMASGTHCDLKGVEYLDLYGEEPSAIEMVFAIFANVLELDEEGKPTNSRYAQKRACAYLQNYVNGTEIDPPYEDWETALH
ncbi:hypothetical protein CLIB1423_02S11540 [[Candida] railenensis]|uniref:DUF7677 domain-containing protein n=1 Tax=[Candida] railenensis TaxID=45579 RepID=A0A9P0QLY1_9ASCO|nr:hypothetical protein CLIB1423_02S11540 [[Candida] railenensis]